VFALSLEAMTAQAIRILGLDPGLTRTGFGVIEARGSKLAHIANGSLATDAKDSLAVRLACLYHALQEILGAHAPEEAAVEITFVNADGAGTLKLGQARAIALLVPALNGLPVAEYAPNLVKKAVVGAGHAEKAQVRAMVERLLPRAEIQGPDAADALAIAICHAHLGLSRLGRLKAELRA
jgi:crossover junction endodeoxyribonuclease RuvC